MIVTINDEDIDKLNNGDVINLMVLGVVIELMKETTKDTEVNDNSYYKKEY